MCNVWSGHVFDFERRKCQMWLLFMLAVATVRNSYNNTNNKKIKDIPKLYLHQKNIMNYTRNT